MSLGKTLIRIVLAGIVTAPISIAAPASAGPVSFNFTGAEGGGYGAGTFGNHRTFSNGNVTVDVSAWGYTFGPNDDALESAALGKWQGLGLGSCNRNENCSSPDHMIDNFGVDEWMLFVFDSKVDISSLKLYSWGNPGVGTFDRDLSFWAGNVATPVDLTGFRYTDPNSLTSLGFGPRVDVHVAPTNKSPIDVSISTGAVNALLIGGLFGSTADANNDFFKIMALNGYATQVPEPGTLLLSMSALGAFVMRHRRRSGVAG
jgi:hypothetical protein